MLFSAAAQIEMLDGFAGTGELVARIEGLYREWKAVPANWRNWSEASRRSCGLLDLWNFQHKEIENADPRPGEDATLEQERKVLQNGARLEDAANAVYSALYDAPESGARPDATGHAPAG